MNNPDPLELNRRIEDVPNSRTPELSAPDTQVADVSRILHEQADRLTDEATHTTRQADQSRAAAERLDEQADDLYQRADQLHARADHLYNADESSP